MVDSKRGVLLELDFSDDELVVRQHPDGMFTIDIAGGRLLLNREQFDQALKGFRQIASDLLPGLTLAAMPFCERYNQHMMVDGRCVSCGKEEAKDEKVGP